MPILVDSTAGLLKTLASAHAGDVIALAPGTYSPILIKNLAFSQNVTITSADPNHQAVLTGFDLRGSSGITLSNVEVFVDPARVTNPLNVASSSGIVLENLHVHGLIDGQVSNDLGGLMIRNSHDVVVRDSEFSELRFAVTHLDSSGVEIVGNYFHDIRTDAIRGGGSSDVTIVRNYFTDFYPDEGDHADAVQFWTTNTTASAHDIVVNDNVVVRGNGAAVQGIFFRDQVGNLPYVDVTVSNNLIVGGLYNGIALSSTVGLTVQGNSVIALPDQLSWLTVTETTNATVQSNVATKFTFDQNLQAQIGGNILAASMSDGGAAYAYEWLQSHAWPLPTAVTADVIIEAARASVENIERTKLNAVTLVGTDLADKLYVDGVHNTFVDGGSGADTLTGGGIAANILAGGDGDDTYFVRSATDAVCEQEGGGVDLVVASVDYALPNNVERLRMADGARVGFGNDLDNRITGTAGDDVIYGLGGADLIQGVGGNDTLRGDSGSDTLVGGVGSDQLIGGADDDKLSGGGGADWLDGEVGRDSLEGGAGADTLYGGEGSDVFIFRDGDIAQGENILDFTALQGDKINLTAVDANTTVTGDQKFVFIGASNFHGQAGELRLAAVEGGSLVLGDVNGDGYADFTLQLKNVSSLQSADFFL